MDVTVTYRYDRYNRYNRYNRYRLERLMERRPELLSSVLLRQNPHNVHEWLKRAQLFDGQPAKVIHTYATAVKTVDPLKATGKPHALWLEFAGATRYSRHRR